MIRTRCEARAAVDTDGTAIVTVPLANSPAIVRLFPEDFAELKAAGFAESWILCVSSPGYAYVRCKLPRSDAGAHLARRVGDRLGVARIVARAMPWEVVKYVDGDRTNLRRDNLRVARGGRSQGREIRAIGLLANFGASP